MLLLANGVYQCAQDAEWPRLLFFFTKAAALDAGTKMRWQMLQSWLKPVWAPGTEAPRMPCLVLLTSIRQRGALLSNETLASIDPRCKRQEGCEGWRSRSGRMVQPPSFDVAAPGPAISFHPEPPVSHLPMDFNQCSSTPSWSTTYPMMTGSKVQVLAASTLHWSFSPFPLHM